MEQLTYFINSLFPREGDDGRHHDATADYILASTYGSEMGVVDQRSTKSPFSGFPQSIVAVSATQRQVSLSNVSSS